MRIVFDDCWNSQTCIISDHEAHVSPVDVEIMIRLLVAAKGTEIVSAIISRDVCSRAATEFDPAGSAMASIDQDVSVAFHKIVDVACITYSGH